MAGRQGSYGPRTALITGASRGLGLALARFLAPQGYRLVIDARSGEALREAAAELSRHTEVAAVPGDVRDPEHRAALVEAAGDSLHLLVNNASELGSSPLPPLERYDLAVLREVLEANLIAPLALVQLALPALRTAHGLVVNVSSDAAQGGYPGWGGYGASKAALDLVSLTLANELEGVAVTAVDPGDMRTEMQQRAFPGEDIADRPAPEATLPFWGWLLEQPPAVVSGRRFQAQGETWLEARG